MNLSSINEKTPKIVLRDALVYLSKARITTLPLNDSDLPLKPLIKESRTISDVIIREGKGIVHLAFPQINIKLVVDYKPQLNQPLSVINVTLHNYE
mgnify:CR=1 FL=1